MRCNRWWLFLALPRIGMKSFETPPRATSRGAGVDLFLAMTCKYFNIFIFRRAHRRVNLQGNFIKFMNIWNHQIINCAPNHQAALDCSLYAISWLLNIHSHVFSAGPGCCEKKSAWRLSAINTLWIIVRSISEIYLLQALDSPQASPNIGLGRHIFVWEDAAAGCQYEAFDTSPSGSVDFERECPEIAPCTNVQKLLWSCRIPHQGLIDPGTSDKMADNGAQSLVPLLTSIGPQMYVTEVLCKILLLLITL